MCCSRVRIPTFLRAVVSRGLVVSASLRNTSFAFLQMDKFSLRKSPHLSAKLPQDLCIIISKI